MIKDNVSYVGIVADVSRSRFTKSGIGVSVDIIRSENEKINIEKMLLMDSGKFDFTPDVGQRVSIKSWSRYVVDNSSTENDDFDESGIVIDVGSNIVKIQPDSSPKTAEVGGKKLEEMYISDTAPLEVDVKYFSEAPSKGDRVFIFDRCDIELISQPE